MERKVQRERSSMQRQLRRLQQQLKSERRRRQQLQAQMQQVRDGQSQQQHLPWHYLLWHQQQQLLRQQQQQQQYLLQQQAHLPQRPLHQPQPPPLLQHDQEKRQRLMQQQEQHVMPVEEGTRQHTQRKRRREEQGELQPREEEQHRPRQHGNQHPGHLVEDEWLEPELPIAQAPQPSTSQQALQHSTAGAAARRSTSEDRSTQVTPFQVAIQLIPVLSSAPVVSISAAAAGDDAPVGPPVGAVTSNAGVALVLAAAEPKFAAPVTTGKAVKLKPRTVSGLQNHGSGKSNGTAAAGTAAAGSAIAASGSTSASTTPTDDSDSVPDDIREHPFVHLPQRLASTTTETVLVDLRRAVTACPGRLDLIPLLQEARDVLSRRFLCLEMQKKLAHLAGALIEHAMNHQHQDLSKVRTTRALVRLALRFLLMDVVVSAFIVLDQTPDGDFWKRFTDTVSHSPPLGPSQGSGEGRNTFALCLARELSKAIVTLKTGVRPKPEDLMRIKHMLFCSPSSPSRFRRPDFDGWRQDSCERIDEQ
ncbi:LOW QUALITY PROTEIN: uncharacterized protein EMH_0045870 [Eimeria mitis]|uniref:Uncharacterized protein n=1 Tax=Eimeria mitis TaxID=44415 RepID=U6KGP7_9EIME|nr:LOW QUALITY PROTEIN: uncharacterized protein EMH_0045870 [Eimeria mitis]CDJ35946.1 hypothetical protein EMH_0045870 [Eimeria mitis]